MLKGRQPFELREFSQSVRIVNMPTPPWCRLRRNITADYLFTSDNISSKPAKYSINHCENVMLKYGNTRKGTCT